MAHQVSPSFSSSDYSSLTRQAVKLGVVAALLFSPTSAFMPRVNQGGVGPNIRKPSKVFRLQMGCMEPTRLDQYQPPTAPDECFARIRKVGVQLSSTGGFPVLGDGLTFNAEIFGIKLNPADIQFIQEQIWHQKDFLPKEPAAELPVPFNVLSDVAKKMASELENGQPGLLKQNQLRQAIAKLDPALHQHGLDLLRAFKQEQDPQKKSEYAKTIAHIAFWGQWLIRGVLFEGLLHGERYTEAVIPKPLSTVTEMMRLATGMLQSEFVYHHYTLMAAILPKNFDVDAIDYHNSSAILQAIADIKTPVGFNDMAGGKPEHNFRFNHVLMEAQLRKAFIGLEQVLAGNEVGWDAIVEAAWRAHKVFETMLTNTPADSYPDVRLPIQGTRSAQGKTYPGFGVFYGGMGEDTLVAKYGNVLIGAYVSGEWGQTGANSSLFKWLDILIGLAKQRDAFPVEATKLANIAAMLKGEIDSGRLSDEPLDAMQRAFDFLTRPPLHMQMLVKDDQRVNAAGLLDSQSPVVLLSRLRIAKWVAKHRFVHAKYVLKAIFETMPKAQQQNPHQPVQSRSTGTGGSPAGEFLFRYWEQTIEVAKDIIHQLQKQKKALTAEQKTEIASYQHEFAEDLQLMKAILAKGMRLAEEEKTA